MSWKSSGSSSGSQGSFPHDIKTGSGLRNLYNQNVVNVQPVERPLSAFQGGNIGHAAVGLLNSAGVETSISGQRDRATHSGALVTLGNGDRYLIHKGEGYGETSQTVVVDAKHMSDKWQSVGSSTSVAGKNVGDFVRAGGADYHLRGGNCHNATNKMKNLGGK